MIGSSSSLGMIGLLLAELVFVILSAHGDQVSSHKLYVSLTETVPTNAEPLQNGIHGHAPNQISPLQLQL